jgi:hypothetical protein
VSRDVLAAWLNSSCGPAEQAPANTPSSPRLAVDVPGAGSRVVFSGVGPPGAGRIWVVPTWLLVLAASGPVLALGLLGVYLPWLRTVPVVLGLAVVAILAAAAFPELAPLVVQAAVPGAALAVLAAALRFVLDERSPTPLPTPTRGPAAVVSASSLTQVAPQPSLIIKPLSHSQAEGPTAAGRDLP